MSKSSTAIFKMDNQQGPMVWNMKPYWMLCASLDGSGAWGRMDSCRRMTESPPCSPETITTLLMGHIPTQNKKFTV